MLQASSLAEPKHWSLVCCRCCLISIYFRLLCGEAQSQGHSSSPLRHRAKTLQAMCHFPGWIERQEDTEARILAISQSPFHLILLTQRHPLSEQTGVARLGHTQQAPDWKMEFCVPSLASLQYQEPRHLTRSRSNRINSNPDTKVRKRVR